jgi:hypothetical protein
LPFSLHFINFCPDHYSFFPFTAFVFGFFLFL